MGFTGVAGALLSLAAGFGFTDGFGLIAGFTEPPLGF